MFRILNLLPWRRRRLERDVTREVRYHLERRIDELRRDGLTEGEARRRAAHEFGGSDVVLEEVRETWSYRWLDVLLRDVRHGARALVRSPGFSVTAVLSLALAIGATAAIFALTDQVLLRKLPVPQPDRLVHLDWNGWSVSSSWGSGNLVSYPLCLELQRHEEVFEGVFCRHPTTVNLSTGDGQEAARAEIVTGSYFRVMGVQPVRGRLIDESDDLHPGAHPVVVLSYEFWKSRMGGVADVVGRTVRVNSVPLTVIGVAPAGFTGVDPVEPPSLWIPATMTGTAVAELGPRVLDRRTVWLHAFARLKAGVTTAQARNTIQPWFRGMLDADLRLESFPSISAEQRAIFLGSTLELMPAGRGLSFRGDTLTKPLRILAAATFLLLVLACLNVAGLLLARGAARGRELATRTALGASRGRITTQLLIESTLITVLGALLGMIAAPVVSRAIIGFVAPGAGLQFHYDARVLLFSSLVSVMVVAAIGAVPALRIGTRSLTASLSERATTRGSGAVRVRRAIVTAEFAFTLVLLIGAGLFVQTLAHLLNKDRGFETGQLIAFAVSPPAAGYDDSTAVQFMRELRQRLAALPGIESVAVSNSSLLSGGSFRRVLTIDADERTVTENSLPGLRVSPGFFAALGTRVIAGREFVASDVPGADDAQYRAAIVNESFARRYYPRGTAVGRRIGIGDRPDTRVEIEIVGVVEDISFRSIREPELEHFFLPFGHPSALSADGAFVLRVHGEPESMLAPVRAAIGEMDPGLPVDNLSTLQERVDHSLATERMLASLSSGFGGVALLLSIIGLYGLVSFVVLQRRQEIGVRVALGALRSDVVWLITRDVLVMTGIGIAVALPAAWALRRIVEAQLYGVAALDPATLIFASAVLAVAAILAAVRPAWRAASVDPTEALRLE